MMEREDVNGRMSFLDLLMTTLQEHEKELSEKIDELDNILTEMRLIERNVQRMFKKMKFKEIR